MDRAVDVHDHVIRTQLGQFNGYEVTTEGDAFLLAFHDASDAIAWSVATQQVITTMCLQPTRLTADVYNTAANWAYVKCLDGCQFMQLYPSVLLKAS